MSTYWFEDYFPEDSTNTDNYSMSSYWPTAGEPSTQSYYSTELSNFLNIFYSANIALENYFTNWLFHGEKDRMIYASTEYAFRRRIELKSQDPTSVSLNTLDFPFMNYRGTMLGTTDRPWKNQNLFSTGIYIPELEQKVRINPVTFEYDATIFCHRDDELQYLSSELAWDNEQETQLEKNIDYSISIDGNDIILPGLIEYNLNHDTMYNENDWLQQNKVHTVEADFTLQTFLLKLENPYSDSNTDGKFAITNEVCLLFQNLHPETDEIASEEIYTYINDYYST
jgi:hypothetical protein